MYFSIKKWMGIAFIATTFLFGCRVVFAQASCPEPEPTGAPGCAVGMPHLPCGLGCFPGSELVGGCHPHNGWQ